MIRRDWGRFTARGGDLIEKELTAIVSQAAETVIQTVPADRYRALVLIGGYGRGEGGVQVVEGIERPHNNLDFLLLTNNLPSRELGTIKANIDKALAPLSEAHQLGFDFSLINISKLRRSPCLVMWYDMRFGHKTLAGDADFVPSLESFREDCILASDVRNLLVNRGTLFVINDALLERGDLNEQDRKILVKHAVKGIIGYGDALLFFLGGYHWSYVEKQRRMRSQANVPENFKTLYDRAMEFRFRPDYASFPGEEVTHWLDSIRPQLADIHLRCESLRLHHELTWPAYPPYAFRQILLDNPTSLRGWAKKTLHSLRTSFVPSGLPLLSRLGFRCGGMTNALPILFPVAAYDISDIPFRTLAQQVLKAPNREWSELRRAYLKQWSIYGDINFPSVLRKLRLHLDGSSG